MSKMKIESKAFREKEKIPDKYTANGEDINPPLEIKNIPENTKSLALIVDDPDAPVGCWVHWLVWNIKPTTNTISQDSVPEGSIQGINDFKKNNYGGPNPPSGTHRYFFKIYALDTILNLDKNSNKEDLLKEMENHIIDQAQLIGLYSKK